MFNRITHLRANKVGDKQKRSVSGNLEQSNGQMFSKRRSSELWRRLMGILLLDGSLIVSS